MLVRVQLWRAGFGNAWIGDRPISGQVHDVCIVERQCECGATIRKLRAKSAFRSHDILEMVNLPVCAIIAHGRTALFPTSESCRDLRLWDWAGHCGGYVIVNPGCLISKHPDDRSSLPAAKPGYAWFPLASLRDVWNEYALLAESPVKHALPIVRLQSECPPCKSAEPACHHG